MSRIQANWMFLKQTLLEKQAIKLIIDNSDIKEVKAEGKQPPEDQSENKAYYISGGFFRPIELVGLSVIYETHTPDRLGLANLLVFDFRNVLVK
jgi:hypothetical protein